MNDIVFFGVTLTYFWFGAKVDEWITIAALGFKFETPSLFLQRPRNYDVFRVVLFLAACVSLYWAKSISWYAGTIVLGAAWFGTTWLGQRNAFTHYRGICREFVRDNLTSEDKAYWETQAEKSNADLRVQLVLRGDSYERWTA